MNYSKVFAGLAFMTLGIWNVSVSQTLKDAIKLTESEQFESAAKVYKSLLEKEPANGELYFYYGENYFNNENLDSALIMYNKGIEVNATQPLNYAGLGKVQWYRGNTQEAKSNFFRAESFATTEKSVAKTLVPIVFMKIAEPYIKAPLKNFDEAFRLLNRAQKLDSKNPEVYLLLGDTHVERNNPTDGSEAVKFYDKAFELDKKSPKSILRKGQLYGRSRNYNEAFKFYKEAGNVDSTFAPAYREKGDLYFRAGQFDKALAQYKRYLELNTNTSAKLRVINSLFLGKKYKEAIEKVQEMQRVDSARTYLYRVLTVSYFETADIPNAQLNSNKFFLKEKDSKNIISMDYEYLGKIYGKSGNDSLAILNLEKAYQLDSTKAELLGDLGMACMKAKKNDKAVTYMERLSKKKPTLSSTEVFNLGRAYYFNSNYDKADTTFGQLIVMQPNLYNGYQWRAKTRRLMDPKDEKWLAVPYAEKFFEKLKPEDNAKIKKDDMIYLAKYLGFYYNSQKDLAKAKIYWEKVKELDPNDKYQKEFFNNAEVKKLGN